MQLSIILTTILLTTLTSPDLCADVYVDENGEPYTDAVGQTWSRFCDQTGPDAPVLDLDVCCTISGDNARCALPDSNGRCSMGSKAYCEYGDVASTGAVVCYQPLTSVCDFGFCGDVLPPNGGPLEDGLCCWPSGACTEVQTVEDFVGCGEGGGISGSCWYGAINVDGTVDCFDE
jgi:hypothetical protein